MKKFVNCKNKTFFVHFASKNTEFGVCTKIHSKFVVLLISNDVCMRHMGPRRALRREKNRRPSPRERPCTSMEQDRSELGNGLAQRAPSR